MRPGLEQRMSSGMGDTLGSLGSLSISGETAAGGGSGMGGKEDVVPVGFDEAVLRALCDMDVSLWGVCFILPRCLYTAKQSVEGSCLETHL